MLPIVFVFFGGGIGAVCRYLISLLSNKFFGSNWQATVFVNALGAIILFFLTKKGLNLFSPKFDLFIKVGLLGAFTTYSTFCFEVVFYIKNGNYKMAGFIYSLNMLLGVIAGILILRSKII